METPIRERKFDLGIEVDLKQADIGTHPFTIIVEVGYTPIQIEITKFGCDGGEDHRATEEELVTTIKDETELAIKADSLRGIIPDSCGGQFKIITRLRPYPKASIGQGDDQGNDKQFHRASFPTV